jgi:hypothetical protein
VPPRVWHRCGKRIRAAVFPKKRFRLVDAWRCTRTRKNIERPGRACKTVATTCGTFDCVGDRSNFTVCRHEPAAIETHGQTRRYDERDREQRGHRHKELRQRIGTHVIVP